MKVINPNYTAPASPLDAKQQALLDWFAANPNVESVTFDQIRANFGKTEQQWPDGTIHAKLIDMGLQVAAE